MTYRIHKYAWEPSVPLQMPKGARILSVQEQRQPGILYRAMVWALVDDSAPLVPRKLGVYGTGHELPSGDPGRFVGTVQLLDGSLVLHFFDQGEGT